MNKSICFLLSIVFSTITLLMERLFEIGVFFHPDSRTYLVETPLYWETIKQDPLFVFNNGYFVLTYFVSQKASVLIMINMIAFAVTNIFLLNKFNDHKLQVAGVTKSTLFYSSFLFFLVIYNPYRLHLSVHVLKDSLILLFLVLLFVAPKRSKIIWFAQLLLLRIFSLSYLILFLKGRMLYWFLFFLAIIIIVFGDNVSNFFLEWNDKDLNFREGVRVPSFQGLGMIGVVIRMIVWPILMLTGFFIFLTPSLLLLPIAFGSFVLQIWSLVYLKRPAVTLSAFGLLALIAGLVPGFTSYQRYCLPIITLLPILLLTSKIPKS